MNRIERVFEVTLHDPETWDEDIELQDLRIVSPAALLDVILKLSYKVIDVPPDNTSVAVSINSRYISPVVAGQTVKVRLFVVNRSERNTLIKTEITDEDGEKCFEGEIVRRTVPKNLIRRLAVEKTAKV
ncbi:MAG: hypothetical protein J7L34_03680 [Thermotogaceae bacterium]|nr:hypothetical protein [Thermotogaceae bacterium]